MAGEHLGVLRRSRRAIGDGRKLGSWSGEWQRHDADVADVARCRPNFDVGYAWNRVRRPDGDEQPVGAGRAVEEYIGASDMRIELNSTDRDHRGDARAMGDVHLWTRCIARPARSPTHIIKADTASAISMPRQNCVGVPSRG